MDWKDNDEQAAFRTEVQDVIQTKLPSRYENGGDWEVDRVHEDPAARQAASDWADALSDKGWVAPAWPKEYGGAGLSPMEQFIFKQEMALANAPGVGGQGVSQLGPTLIVHGTEEQKKEHLPKILSGEVNWRQGYSEPGSGSDLASLQTRAVRDGDDFVINGQKIWTSGAHRADWLYALVRTDPEAPKHRGISFLILDKDTPGITIRPLIDMSWRHHFNEVFFEDVRVPASNLIGEENRGWYVGMTLLDFERSNITGAITSRRSIRSLLEYLDTDEGAAKANVTPSVRTAIADRYVETEVMFNFSLRIITMQEKGLVPMDAPYVAASRGGTKALRVFREHDEEREQLYTSRFAVPGAEKKVKKKLEKKPDLVVMISASRKERECVHCKAKVYKGTFFLMEDDGMVCLECADMDHLLFLPSGDAALTRRSRKYSSLCAVVVEFSRSRGRYERQGLLVTEEAVNQAEEECIKDADQRAARREERRARVAQEDEAYARDVEDALSVWYPNCPAEEIQSIAYHTTVRGSGRVGRSSAARELLRDMFKLAVIAHIRHQHTNYDELLMSGVPREEARMSIHNEVNEILRRWQGE